MVREELDDLFNMRSGKVQWELLAIVLRMRRRLLFNGRRGGMYQVRWRQVVSHGGERVHRLQRWYVFRCRSRVVHCVRRWHVL